jgi:hypothetical protein
VSEQKTINDGGPAFPVPGSTATDIGMTLRDWFAGQALAGILNGCMGTTGFGEVSAYSRGPCNSAAADRAYAVADAMLKAREVQP